MWSNPHETEVNTLTEETLNEKLHFLCSGMNERLEKFIQTTCVFYHINCEYLGKNIYIYKIITNLECVYVISLFGVQTMSVCKVKCFFVKYQEKRRDALTCSPL